MKKIWLLSILLLLSGCSMSIENNNQSESVTNSNNSNSYISENVECQEMLNDFENNYPKDPKTNHTQTNYNIFYSPIRESCIWTYQDYYYSNQENEDCFYIVDLFDPAYEESFCFFSSLNKDYDGRDYYAEDVRSVNWNHQDPFFINGVDEEEWLKEDRIQYLKWNIKESEIDYKKYAHPKSYSHALINK